MERKKRVGHYQRVSSKGQERDDRSFKRQYDKAEETYNVRWYFNEVVSNDKPLEDRKAWKNTINCCVKDDLDGIVVEFYDRISRDINILFDFLDYAKEKDVKVYDAYAECELCAEMDRHRKGTAGLTVFKDKDMIKKVDADRKSRGKKYAEAENRRLGGQIPLSEKKPSDHRRIMKAVARGRYQVEQEWRTDKKPRRTWGEIADILNKEGIKTASGCEWTASILRKYIDRKNNK